MTHEWMLELDCQDDHTGHCAWQAVYSMLRGHLKDERFANTPIAMLDSTLKLFDGYVAKDLGVEPHALTNALDAEAASFREPKDAKDEGESATA
jgi:hypothetical protein